jgi:multiple sugar transport system permease protein
VRPTLASDEARRAKARARAVRFSTQTLIHVVLIVGGLAVLFPFFWMIASSLKEDWEVFLIPPSMIPVKPLWHNYLDVLSGNKGGFSFLGFVRNTAVITLVNLVGVLLTAPLVAYGFARLRFPGRDALFMLMLATMMIPHQVLMIPIYLIWSKLGFVDTYVPLTIGAFLGGGAFYIFLLRQFIMTIPREYDDAARIDGCGWLGIYRRIILPMAKPALGTVAIFTFMASWNDFMGPLIYISSMPKYTLAIGLHFFVSNTSASARPLWNLTMAASVVAMLPPLLLFFLAQRYYIQGVVVSGIKG